MKNRRKLAGFTLIELMITVAILGIIASVALPSYFEHVKRTARTEAVTALLDAANRQEQFFVDNRQYTDTLTDIGVTTPTEHGFYKITVERDNAAGTFSFTATPVAGPTLKDDECKTLTIDDTGLKTSTGSADHSRCWGK
ncbi:type IV pilin protein [Pseudoalteromonas sp. NEC-BIFX-2020_002]|uniref:Type IV pilin protein n=1 Tax=Pseudoalteromonas neustonica TaxID=1840331 RepID=A0ABU9TZ02_9GAMM|nr:MULTISPECIES: type IV pilin protein [unclassified Pseudoalteromonas]NMR27902.1 type IV pilin protein [Pseudoalteromonas sp. NEC-BIFX-2020_015]NNG43880.1 type IV pilin protein [Pseudoalteromonas sp. NEC-BIFX-2020_002]